MRWKADIAHLKCEDICKVEFYSNHMRGLGEKTIFTVLISG